MPKSRIAPPSVGARLAALDPTRLGRPFHRLPVFVRLLREALDAFVERELNARYRTRLAIRTLEARPSALRHHWLALDDLPLGVAVARPLLLYILEHRYGGRGTADGASRETDTEHRLARLLAQRLAPCVAQALAQLGHGAPGATVALPFAPGRSAWEAVLTLDAADGPCGEVALALSDAAFDAVLAALAAPGERRPMPPAAPLAESLRLPLTARLAQATLPLGDVMALSPGGVLPLRLAGRADVMVGDARLFTASVAESQGRLCLTSFDDAE